MRKILVPIHRTLFGRGGVFYASRDTCRDSDRVLGRFVQVVARAIHQHLLQWV